MLCWHLSVIEVSFAVWEETPPGSEMRYEYSKNPRLKRRMQDTILRFGNVHGDHITLKCRSIRSLAWNVVLVQTNNRHESV